MQRFETSPGPWENDQGQEIIELTRRGLDAGVDHIPTKPVEPSPSQRFAADALWAAVQALAVGRSIDAALITSRQEIGELYRHLAAGTDPSELRLMKGWRREAIGGELVRLFAGEVRYAMSWGEEGLAVRTDR